MKAQPSKTPHNDRQPEKGVSLSIGMPVYNAEVTIGETLDSLLQQTFRNFELIISDNASTDATWSIIQGYARLDKRIVALRQPRNIGANHNYCAVFRMANARYFKWASSNDWCAPTFLEQCVEYLETHKDTVLVSPRTRLFAESVTNFRDDDRDSAFDELKAVDRLLKVWSHQGLNNVINGVARSEALKRTRLIDDYPAADIVLLGHLALQGKIALLDDHLFYRRMDPRAATSLMDKDAWLIHHYPRRTLRSLFPQWRFIAGSVRAIVAARLSAAESWRALEWMLRVTYRRRRLLLLDLVDAVRYPIYR